MPHIPVHPSAEKRRRQNLKRRERNRSVKTHVRTMVKQAAEAIAGSDAGAAEGALKQATKVLYKAASKGTLHRNTAARKVSRLAKQYHRVHAAAAKSAP